jgi:hypothetical protein
LNEVVPHLLIQDAIIDYGSDFYKRKLFNDYEQPRLRWSAAASSGIAGRQAAIRDSERVKWIKKFYGAFTWSNRATGKYRATGKEDKHFSAPMASL